MNSISINPNLTRPDHLVLENLLCDIKEFRQQLRSTTEPFDDFVHHSQSSNLNAPNYGIFGACSQRRDHYLLQQLRAFNDPKHDDFVPTVLLGWDIDRSTANSALYNLIIHPYVRWARKIVRSETDVVMLTHLLLYFTTSVPSAALLFCRFSLVHGLLHSAVQIWFASSYTLMMHQHVHMRGILQKKYRLIDRVFPFITDPLMGHTWNSYFYHHVKHHHIERNGPGDLSSTIRYQRDDLRHLLWYLGRFLLLGWLELPLYFFRKKQAITAMKTAFFEVGSYIFFYTVATRYSFLPTLFVFLIPLLVMRTGLMVGNWGQHAFVDDTSPDSDFRSSITLIDVTSNRYCYNDGYHTSHHLNPHRHWRDHPVSLIQQKRIYGNESALIFCNIDYFTITMKLIAKDYRYLARCLVPIGSQMGMTVDEIAKLLETKTRRFTKGNIKTRFPLSSS